MMTDAVPEDARPYVFALAVTVFISLALLIVIGFGRKQAVGTLAMLPHRGNAWQLRALAWVSVLLLLMLWANLSYVSPGEHTLVPTPNDIVSSFWTLTTTGTLGSEAWASIQRILVGFSCAAVLGVTIGVFAGSFLIIRQAILPINSFLRYIPPTAFISLLIVYFGIGETYKYAVIFIGVIFFIIQMVVDVVDDVDVRYVEMAKASGFSNFGIFRNVIVPSAAPRILDVIRINVSAAWTFLVAAELIGSDRGLGHMIAVSQRFLRLGDLYVGIITFGVIGIVTDTVLGMASRRLFPWYFIWLKQQG